MVTPGQALPLRQDRFRRYTYSPCFFDLLVQVAWLLAKTHLGEKSQFVIEDKNVSRKHMTIEVAKIPEGKAVSN